MWCRLLSHYSRWLLESSMDSSHAQKNQKLLLYSKIYVLWVFDNLVIRSKLSEQTMEQNLWHWNNIFNRKESNIWNPLLTPQQNGRVERKHRHILNVSHACMFQAHLLVTFWGQCILTAANLINCTPTKLLNGCTPYELLHGTPPKQSLLRVFGCLCYAQRRPRNSNKFDVRSRKCIFVGYPYGKKAWNVYYFEDNVFFTSCDVVFFEDQFPGLSPPQTDPSMPLTDLTTDDWLSLPPSQPTPQHQYR